MKLKDFAEKTDREDNEVHNHNIDNLRVQTRVKLLIFVLQKFDGNILRWKQLEESFEAAVHNNERIPNVEKFTYSIGYLEQALLQAVGKFPLTNDTYNQAWELLKERYGNPQLINFTHINELIKLNKIKRFKCNRIERII